MTKVSAVLLAAGVSSRMGEINKLELMVDGIPLLRRTAEMLLASDVKEIVVVLGYEAQKTRSMLQGLPVRFTTNDAYSEGQMTSVYTGLLSIAQDCDGVMICLSDQPLLQAADINVLIDAFGKRSHGSILVPTFEGQRGNPIIFDFRHRQEILNGKRNFGCKKLIEKNAQEVCSFEMKNNHVVLDLDTPEQYAAFKAQSINLRDVI
ncbi:MAG: molybdenum cofactor cytidylyltransferase [Paraglaciecola sp.]|jgi:molybdenum cofactor cytidylyltransferase